MQHNHLIFKNVIENDKCKWELSVDFYSDEYNAS